MIIAVDGPAASGKGTISRRIAAQFGYAYLDTGLLYRAVARDVRAASGNLESEAEATAAAHRLDTDTLDDATLRLPGVGDAASVVARHPGVRQALLALQRDFASQLPGAVLDGRDIGTVVCPDADVKLFVTADAQVRARRRFLELIARGEPVTREGVLNMILVRDRRDRERADSPMHPAADALLLNTTNLDINQAFDAALELIKRKISQSGA